MARPDAVEHLTYAYLITLLSLAGPPRLPPWALAAGLLAAGIGVELLRGCISAQATLSDAAADLVGVAMAMAPYALGRLGRRHAS